MYFSGEAGLIVGDIVSSINTEDLKLESFITALKNIRESAQTGFCHETVESEHFSISENCCPEENSTHICFAQAEDILYSGCLKARLVISESSEFCLEDSQCADGKSCIIPVVNSRKVFKLESC